MTKKEAPAATPAKEGTKPTQDGVRDAVESIVFAFLLALVFKTFEAEMFVIPTGSMAPTLYGRHKETVCTQCGNHIVVGASTELDRDTGRLQGRIEAAVCPNCGAVNEQIFDTIPFNGDRICVTKYPYEFGEPDRWDVFVFKYPEMPQTNYIKRLVGLPGETLRIRNGNVYTWDGERETILRKSPDKQKVIQIPVHDNAHVPRKLIAAGWPERWAAVKKSEDVLAIGGWADAVGTWKFDSDKRQFSLESTSPDPQWIRYRHYAPSVEDWGKIESGLSSKPRPRLVGDFCGYNAFSGERLSNGSAYAPNAVDRGPFWDPDLTVSFEANISEVQEGSQLILELCEGVFWYRCHIDVSTGVATLYEINSQLSETEVRELAKAETGMQGGGSYTVEYANVDDRLCLWINGRLAEFGAGAEREVSGATSNPFPTDTDLTPVGIAAAGMSAEIGELKLFRDIYYRGTDYLRYSNTRLQQSLESVLHDPAAWGEIYARSGEDDRTEIQIPENHYVALGDNSPESADSRLWSPDRKTVPREFLVGKAFFIYWPHAVPFLNNGNGYSMYPFLHADRAGNTTNYPTHSFPFYPQFWRMKRIR